MSEQLINRELELLRQFRLAWQAWCASPSYVTEQPLKEIDRKLREMEE